MGSRAGRGLAVAAVAAVAVLAAAPAGAAPDRSPWPWVTPPSPPRATPAPLEGTGCPVFPSDNIWHADVSGLPLDPRSAQWKAHMQAGPAHLHPDFGPSGGFPYGIPVTVVAADHPTVFPRFDYAGESDPGPYPLGADVRVEGGPGAGGDRHAIVVNAGTCRLYETYATRQVGSGWAAGSGATWDLTSNALRPPGWTSADAAGLPILPGLLRWSEVEAGSVDHAIRFTTDVTDRSYRWPARHQAGSVNDPTYPPMGAWFRLRADYPTVGLSPETVTVVRAMQVHGLVLADNGSPWYFQGDADTRWPDRMISELKQIPAGAFDAVDVSSLQVSGDSGRTPVPPSGLVPRSPQVSLLAPR